MLNARTCSKRLLFLCLACCSLLPAAERSVHWSELSTLVSGKHAAVTLVDGHNATGTVQEVLSDSISINTKKGLQFVPRAVIRDIRIRKGSGYKWRVLGVASGAGVGGAIAIPVLTETHNEGSGAYDGAAAGLILGLAALGFLAGWSADRSSDILHLLPD